MARMPDAALVPFGPWPRGANNIAREDSVPATAFRRGVNVDVYPGGKTRRRKGHTLVDSTPARNLWSDGEYALCTSFDGTKLYRFVPGQPLVQLYDGFTLDSDIGYCSANQHVRVSDGATALRVDTTNDSVLPWGVESPPGQPSLTAADGGLDPGAYQVAITYVRADGEESGTPLAASIDLPTGGGIRAQLSGAFVYPTGVTGINLYVTPSNGGNFQLYDTYPVGALDVTITNKRPTRPLYTQGLERMPAGELATLSGGRLLVAVDNLVVWSEALFFGLTNYARNYVAYSGRVTMLAAVSPGAASTGVFVAAGEKTFFLSGNDLPSAANQLSYNCGAVRGALTYVHGDDFGVDGFPSQPLPTWLATSGVICVGMPDGRVVSLTNGRYEMRVGDRASIAQRELAGVNQLRVGVRSPRSLSVGVSSDSADTILVRNGVEIP
jgi:hypothetical protein